MTVWNVIILVAIILVGAFANAMMSSKNPAIVIIGILIALAVLYWIWH